LNPVFDDGQADRVVTGQRLVPAIVYHGVN
jgi:hypothetical protein